MTQYPGPGHPVPPPPRPQWGAGRIVLATFGGVVLVLALAFVVLVISVVPFGEQQPQDAARDPRGRIVEKATVDKDSLRPGDCVNDAALRDLEPGGDLQTRSDVVEVVPCRRRHDFEVTATFRVPDDDYSDEAAIRRAVHRGCLGRLRREWSRDRALLRDKILAYYLPAAGATRDDNAVCMLQLASAEQMRGPIR